MSKLLIASALLFSGLVAACGGGSGSGLSGSLTLASLDDAELNDLCAYVVDVTGAGRSVDCGDGSTVTVESQTVAECVLDLQDLQDASPNCSATVNDAETCAEGLADFSDAQLCSGPPAACLTIAFCEF